MFVTVVAVLCHLGSLAAGRCVEEIVTDSSMTPEITFQECVKGAQAPLAKWVSEHPIYHSNWRVDRYKCVLPNRRSATSLKCRSRRKNRKVT